MAVTSGYILSGIIALAIIVIGARFLLAPYVAAAGFGVAVTPHKGWDAYLSVKGIRDIVYGPLAAILIINHSAHPLGWFMLAAAIIPLTDGAIVLRHGGSRATAFGVHGATAVVMLITSGLLLQG
jgi:Domain of unknown function (DUF4267)